MLPGKICIGILEEDNPLKSYFRFKPLLVEVDGRYQTFDGVEAYPEEGCIRIVPDKNESSHFKARMRRMGRYCVLDLREHTGESDKIRPNKNYHGDESERNAHIVYSDVVREPAKDMIFEILPEDCAGGSWNGDAPGTPRVLIGAKGEIWTYAAADPETPDACGQLTPDGESLSEAEIQRFALSGFNGETLRMAIRLPSAVESVIELPQPPAERPAPKAPPVSEAAAEAAAPEKPWINRSAPAKAEAGAHGRMSAAQQMLAMQSGLNPRRNHRSLQEIIEEKWAQSRMDQLGHPIPAKATGQPLESPLENVLDALRNAWSIPEIRGRLVESISQMEEFSEALDHRCRAMQDHALRHDLEELEAERLKSLDELDKLRRDKLALRERFKQEIREEETGALRDLVNRTNAARAECTRQEAAANEAREAAAFAKDAFDSLTDGRFEEKLLSFACTSRAAKLLADPRRHSDAPCIQPSSEPIDREQWIHRMQRAAACEGLSLNRAQAANLLVCIALNDRLLLSGYAAADKRAVGRAIARAMGAMDAKRYVETDGVLPKGFNRHTPLPAVALIENANATAKRPVDRALSGAAENLIVISILSDAGAPVCAETLERSFFLRVQPETVEAPWTYPSDEAEAFAPAAMSDLRKAILDHPAPLPPALERRMQKLRDALVVHNVRLSRTTLNQMARFCGAMLAMAHISPGEALDLAFAQKALPCILAEAPVECLIGLSKLLSGMPHSLVMLNAPLPIQM